MFRRKDGLRDEQKRVYIVTQIETSLQLIAGSFTCPFEAPSPTDQPLHRIVDTMGIKGLAKLLSDEAPDVSASESKITTGTQRA